MVQTGVSTLFQYFFCQGQPSDQSTSNSHNCCRKGMHKPNSINLLVTEF